MKGNPLSKATAGDLDQAWLRALPKVSLHCHLEGTLQPASYRRMAEKYGIDRERLEAKSDDELYRFSTFGEFLMIFRDVCVALREPADYALMTREYLESALAQGVVAAEIFVSPAAWLRLHPQIDIRAVFEAIAAELHEFRRCHDFESRLICDVTRNFGADIALETVGIAIAMRDLGVVAVGIGGDEVHFPAELFEHAFRVARDAGLRCVAHAGEVAGAQSVRAAVEILGAERIGHGVRAFEDASVMQLLAERGIAVEQAPTSNYRTGAVTGEHPIGRFVAAGIRVAIDADDPAIFGAGILDEYANLGKLHGPQFLIERAYDAIAASFFDAVLRRRYTAMLDEFAGRPVPIPGVSPF